MSDTIRTLLICAAALIAMGVFIGILTARSVGGFLENIRKEEEEREEEDHHSGTESEH